MRPLWLLTLLLALPGCSGPDGTSGPSAPLPGASPSRTVSADQLDGVWVFGDTQEPPAGPVTDCLAYQTMTIQTVQPGALHASVSTCIQTCEQLESLDGLDAHGQVQLAGSFQGNAGARPSVVSYALTFDPASQHLKGTRNGVSFWAAPYAPSAGCPPSPTPGPSRSPFNP